MLASRGLATLGAFSSGDDFHCEPLTWHEAAAALPSVEAIREALRRKELFADSPEALDLDLDLLVERLRSAEKLNVRFCLLMHTSSGTSWAEHATRRGTFFGQEVGMAATARSDAVSS